MFTEKVYVSDDTWLNNSPEFEALPPLNLDLMSEPEMQDLFNRHRQQSPVQDISSRHQNQQTPSTSPPVQDLITFQVILLF